MRARSLCTLCFPRAIGTRTAICVVIMVKCPAGHSLRSVKLKSIKECNSCDCETETGSDIFRCSACDYDLCTPCFKTAQKSQDKVAKGKSLVKHDFLKARKVAPKDTSTSSASGSMSVDAKAVFSFSGFPMNSVPFEIYSLIREHVHDYLGEFALIVIGTCVSEGVAHVGVEYQISQAEALEAKIFEFRDHWIFEGTYLTTHTVDHPEVFTEPMDPTVAAGAALTAAPALRAVHVPVPVDPLTEDDPWTKADRYQYGSPIQTTHRSATLHSGITPDLNLRRQTVDDFLAAPPSVPARLVVPPMPGQDADPTLVAILEGVNELRSSSVTMATLKEFAGFQREEFQTFVRAENAPLHDAVGRLGRDVAHLVKDSVEKSDRLTALEAREHSLGSATVGPNPHDIALRRVAFVNFPEASSIKDRIKAMDAFMEANFPNIPTGLKDMFPDKKGNPTHHGFVEVGSRAQARRITDEVKSRTLKLPQFGVVTIKPALTAIDRNRNWAIAEATRLIKNSPLLRGRAVDVKKFEGRGIYVDGAKVFSQEPRFAMGGTFLREFAALRLPA